MKQFTSLLLDVWRETGLHSEIQEAVSRIAPLLAQHTPLQLLLVRQIDVQRSCVDTIAAGTANQAPPPKLTRTLCTAAEMENLLAWCRQDELLSVPRDADRSDCHPYAPEGMTGDMLIGPLLREAGPGGLLIMMATAGRSFGTGDGDLFRALRTPLAVALENDRRLREMEAYRQAAEADRQSLLARLGRQDISDTIVGAESGLRETLERVDLVARSDVPVLLLGETGSGKEVIARAIHTRSPRTSGPFMRVNCGAIPAELIDSELFGHERGSFTGAVALRKGWFERADEGTLFLDEVGELPAAAQVRLLRILQDGTFERVGGEKPLKVDVRIVAATHRDLQSMVAEGTFRADLWYRLAVFPIELPSLRNRPEDMPALAAHFALRAAKRFGLPIVVPTPEDIRALLAYDWPGNIRELASVINRAAILGNGRKLEIAKAMWGAPAPPRPVAEPGPARPIMAPPIRAIEEPTSPFPSLDTVIRNHIETALKMTHGRIEGPFGAARLLGVNPHTLRARMRKLNVDWRRFRPPPASSR